MSYMIDFSDSNIKKKIVFFSPNLAGGGAERVISILATYFAEKNYNVDLILSEAIGPYLENLPASVKVINLKNKKVLFSLPKLTHYLRIERPDILFTSQMHTSTIALWATKLARVKTRVFVRQPTMLKPNHQKKSLILKVKQKFFLQTVGLAEKIIVTSEMMADEFESLSKLSRNKIEVIYNPVPIQEIQRKSKEPISCSWFKTTEIPVILAVGRLETVKDFEVLIKAYNVVRKKTPARLIILGEGSLRDELEHLIDKLDIKEFVKMPGFVTNPYQYMKHAKVFVLSSLWEGFPNVMIEAMACGARIVATECEGGVSEALEQGKWGGLVPVRNEKLMAEAILRSLAFENKPDVLERVKDFSIDIICKKYEEVFQLHN